MERRHNFNNHNYNDPDYGMAKFIKDKLAHGHNLDEIIKMLYEAGFDSNKFERAYKKAKIFFKDLHRDEVANNDFLPVLNSRRKIEETESATEGTIERTVPKQNKQTKQPKESKQNRSVDIDKLWAEHIEPNKRLEHHERLHKHRGLFVGKMRRMDFIPSFLLLFSLSIIAIYFVAGIISIINPPMWQNIINIIKHDTNGVLLLSLPVALLPTTLLMLSIISRRLHCLGLPGGLSFLYLTFFISPFSEYAPGGLLFLQAALGVLFILLITLRGNLEHDEHGPFPNRPSETLFKKIVNL